MVPRDQPAAAQQMLETWVLGVLEGWRKGGKSSSRVGGVERGEAAAAGAEGGG